MSRAPEAWRTSTDAMGVAAATWWMGVAALATCAGQRSARGVGDSVLLQPQLLEERDLPALEERLLAWEYQSLQFLFNKSSNSECPTQYKPEFGSCCLHSSATNGRDDRTNFNCFADLTTNYLLLPPTRRYRSMKDVMLLANQRLRHADSPVQGPVRWRMVGDSIQLQFLNAMQCSYIRSGLRTERTVVHDWSHTSTSKSDWQYGARMNVTLLSEAGAVPHEFSLTRMYRPPRPADLQTQLAPILEGADIVLLNFGLHYRWRDRVALKEQLRPVLQLVANTSARSPQTVFIWRESSAQHHVGVGGEFSIAHMPETNLSKQEYRALFMKCSSHRTQQPLVFAPSVTRQWREQVVTELAAEVGLELRRLGDPGGSGGGVLHVLPMFAYTERFADMHPYRPNREGGFESTVFLDARNRSHVYRTCDPTHFCYSPLFWQPLVDGLHALLLNALPLSLPGPATEAGAAR